MTQVGVVDAGNTITHVDTRWNYYYMDTLAKKTSPRLALAKKTVAEMTLAKKTVVETTLAKKTL